MFAGEIRKRRIEGMKSSRWRWHLDEMFVKINGEQHYIWRAADHEGGVPDHRRGDAAVPADAKSAEFRRRSRLCLKPLQQERSLSS